MERGTGLGCVYCRTRHTDWTERVREVLAMLNEAENGGASVVRIAAVRAQLMGYELPKSA